MRQVPVVPFLAIATLGGLLLGCPPSGSTAFSPKCPEHLQNWMAADSADGTAYIKTINAIPASGSLADLPEVHDCQRLIETGEAGGRAYGPLGVLFASRALDSLFLNARGEESRRPDRAAATINSWPEGYGPLWIPAGWSCLYIVRGPQFLEARKSILGARGDSAAANRIVAQQLLVGARDAVDSALIRSALLSAWAGAPGTPPGTPAGYAYVAYVVPADATGDAVTKCDGPPPSDLGEYPALSVVATPVADLLAAAGPTTDPNLSAARWDADFGNGGRSQHISIRCGDAWCDVMPVDADGPVPNLVPDELPEEAFTALKGAYDQQYLAVPGPSSSPGTLVPGNVLATYAPLKGLERLGGGNFADWQAVGFIHLAGGSAVYKDKLNLSEGLNTVYLRKGPRKSGEDFPDKCETADEAKHNANPWWVRIEGPDGNSSFFCGYKHQHPGPDAVGLPGIVRWRWLDQDETTWQRCEAGCCPIS